MTDGVSAAVGGLFIVPTPIGNLEDITLRALRTLREADFIAAEDTRRTRQLLTHFQIACPRLFSYREQNARAAGSHILTLLSSGMRGALVSDAGMPGISDPGIELVTTVLEAGFTLTVLPGPTALTVAVVGSGLSSRQFIFYGFLPRAEKDRKLALRDLGKRPETLVFYEAPHRILAVLRTMAQTLGDRRAVVARELTKVHETFHRGTLTELLARMEPAPPRGELVVVVEGCKAEEQAEDGRSAQEGADGRFLFSPFPVAVSLAEHMEILKRRGLSPKEAMREAAQARGASRRDVYQALLDESGNL